MREQTAPQHSSEVHERAALARGAFVPSTATNDLAIQAEDCIPEREHSGVMMVPYFGRHIYINLCREMWEATLHEITESFSVCMLPLFQWLGNSGPRHDFPRKDNRTARRVAVAELSAYHRHFTR